MLLIHGSDIIEPIKIGERLQIGSLFNQLLGTSVKKANMGIHALHDLPIELKHKPEHAVSRWCCGPKLIVKFGIEASPWPIQLPLRALAQNELLRRSAR